MFLQLKRRTSGPTFTRSYPKGMYSPLSLNAQFPPREWVVGTVTKDEGLGNSQVWLYSTSYLVVGGSDSQKLPSFVKWLR